MSDIDEIHNGDEIEDTFAMDYLKQKTGYHTQVYDTDNLNNEDSSIPKMNTNDQNDQNEDLEDIVVGIDLGTTNSCVSIWRKNNLEIIPDEFGNKTIPSYVAYTNINRYIGSDARNQRDINPDNVYYEVKRLIGRKYEDPEVQKERKLLSYQIGDSDGNIVLKSNLRDGKSFTPEEISANILTKLKNMASTYLNRRIEKAVITIPAYFSDSQRQATKDAAKIAGLDCIRMVNEPTAASLAYGLMNRTIVKDTQDGDDKDSEDLIRVIVYDFGGGTLDVSLVEIENMTFQVLSSAGNTHFGGADFDNRLIQFSLAKFKYQNNINQMDDIPNVSLQRLRLSCENAKKILSTNNQAFIAVQNFFQNKDLYISITRSEFEKICADLFLLCLKPIDDVLKSCDMTMSDIDEIIMVGGMTRMPGIMQRVEMRFGKKPNCSINPDEAISAGASILGYIISHKRDPFSDSVTLLDIIPLSMGVETTGGIFDAIIPRNTIIPCSETRKYTTDNDYVDSVLIKIYEGERTMTKDNIFVGEFELKGIPLAVRGIPEIDVTFNVDSNGIVTVTAEDTDTHEKSFITVNSNKGRLSKEQIDLLIEESKDLEIRDELEKRKKLFHYEVDDLCSNILTNISKNEFKLSEYDKKIITDDINITLGWLKEKKYHERDIEELEDVVEKIKKRYGVLILKGSISDTTVKEAERSDNKMGTTVYGNDEDEDGEDKNTVFEQIENEKLGLIGMTEPDKAELKDLRQSLTDLCYSVFDVIASGSLTLNNDHLTELKDFIDDTLLWLHVHDKPTKIDYKEKIDAVNDACNKMMEHYKDEVFDTNTLVDYMKTKKDELESLCLTLQIMLEKKAFPLKQYYLDEMMKSIDDNLEFIYKTEKMDDAFEAECFERFTKLSDMCTDYNNKMSGINLDKRNNIIKESVILTGCDLDSENMGTSIQSLIKQRVDEDIKEMIMACTETQEHDKDE